MSVLVVGLSHRTAPVALLEKAALAGDAQAKLLADVAATEHTAESLVLSTCNRVEVYADVDKFHGALTDLSELLARYAGVPLESLTPHLYVHYEDRAVAHLFSVVCGLDSMVVGESQIVGQVKHALRLAQAAGTTSRVLSGLVQQALRVGKRARTETGIDRAGRSLVTAGLAEAVRELGTLTEHEVLVVGAGSMSGLATATAARSGAASITVANRTRKHAERLAASVSTVTTTVTGLADLPAAIAAADVVISCTGAAGQVITGDMVSAALAARTAQQAKVAQQAKEATATTAARGTLVIMDLAMPRDVEAAVADLPGVVLIGMDQLSEHAGAVRDDDVAAVRTILEAELAAYQSAMDAARVAPTVVALRTKAAGVVDAELARLAGRLSADDLSGHALDEIAQSVRRVVDKLLHAPTVRVKELAGSPGGEEYAAALRVLFDLDPRAVEAVTRAAPEQEGSR